MESGYKANFIKTCKDYCFNTTLHGYKYLVLSGRKLWERLIWTFILIVAVISTIYLFKILLMDYYSTSTVTTMESYKYPLVNVPFPGVAVCNINKISKKRALSLAKELQVGTNYSLDVVFDAVRYLGRLYDYEVDEIEKVNLLGKIFEHSSRFENNPDELLNILQMLAPTCDEILLKCIWQGVEVNCTEILRLRRTMDGFCCSFNYLKKFADIEDVGSMKKVNTSTQKTNSTFTPNAGLLMGLSLVLTANLEDYYYPLISAEGLSVKIFNSYDYPDSSSGGLSETFLPLSQEVFMHLSATTVSSVQALRDTSKDARECIFENEATTAFDTSYYSYSDCLAECKMKSILAICECIPFFMPVLRTYKFSKQLCTLSDIACLNKYKGKWINIYPDTDRDELDYERENSVRCPKCVPSCTYVSYSVATNYAHLVETNKPTDLVKGMNLTDVSVVHVYFGTEYTTLYKTDLFYYWFDVISNFGGICSLFLGFSLISITEFLYFFTLRYFHMFQINTPREFLH